MRLTPVLAVAELVARLCGGPGVALSASEARLTQRCDTSRAASLLAFRPTPLGVGLIEEINWLRRRLVAAGPAGGQQR